MTTSAPENEEQRRARERAEMLASAFYRPISRATKLNAVAILVASCVGLLVALATHQAYLAIATTTAIATTGGLVAWAWLRSARDRAALEVLNDHNCHEWAEWKTETGTTVPRSVREARQWLWAHPDSPGRATVLVRLGRLAEARSVIDATTPTTPEGAFGLELMRKSIELYAGERPDVSGLHAEWQLIPDLGERRHRRECLALLDAQIAIDEGSDPWSVLASARADLGDVHSSQTAMRFAARLALVNVLTVIAVVLVGTIVVT